METRRSHLDPRPRIRPSKSVTLFMSTFLVAIHLIVDTNGPNPRAEIIAALEAQLDQPAAPVPATGGILDWAVAGEDLAASMAPVTIPSDYRPGTTQFPRWPRVVPRRAAS